MAVATLSRYVPGTENQQAILQNVKYISSFDKHTWPEFYNKINITKYHSLFFAVLFERLKF